MKIRSLLTYTATASLIAFLASLIVTQDAVISCAVLAATMTALITLHDYSPRKYFIVSAKTSRSTSAKKAGPAFSTFIGATRRFPAKRGISWAA